MKHTVILLLAMVFFLCLLLTGCRTPSVVQIWQKDLRDNKWYRGTGVVVAEDKVITPYHVVDGGQTCRIVVSKLPLKYKEFHRQKYIMIDGNTEPFVILTPFNHEYRFAKRKVFPIGTGAPYRVITLRGIFFWNSYSAMSGDSGSAVVNGKGELIGIVYGHKHGHRDRPIFLRVKKDLIE